MTDYKTRGFNAFSVLTRAKSTAVLRECGYEVKAMTEQNEFLALADQIEREGVKVYGVWHPEATVQSMIVAALRASGHGAGREAPEGATHMRRPEFMTAWLFDRKSTMPVWLIERFKERALPDDRIGHYATAVEGEFWRWFDPAKFNEMFVALTPVALERTAGRETDHPDCRTDRERELYDALMGLASHAAARHRDFSQWTQGGVTLEPIVRKALRLDASPDDQPAGCESAARSARIAIDKV